MFIRSKTFRDYLQERHAKNYNWTDDSMPDAFENWLCDKRIVDMLELAWDALLIEEMDVDTVFRL